MKRLIADIFRVWKHEFSVVYADLGVVIFFFLLPFAYPLIYSAIYNPELARDVPIVVVDECRTMFSREYARNLDASQYVKLSGYAANISEARKAMAEKKCYAIVYIPNDFDKKIGRGESSAIEIYCDMSLLLRYKSILVAATNVSTEMGLQMININEKTQNEVEPISYTLIPIGNVSEGLASAIMPGVLVLIIHQAIILAVCFLGVNARNKSFNTSLVGLVLGKALCYFTLMIVPCVFVFHFVPIIFSFPMNGSLLDIITFFVPFLLATIFFGLTLQAIVPDREATFPIIVFTSVVFIFLSGISWPRYAMSEFWQLLSNCLPSTWGIAGFVEINTAGATLAQQSTAYLALWILTLVYFITSLLVHHYKKT